MKRYSHSKLSTFEICPYCYKLKYIDKIKVKEVWGIETFLLIGIPRLFDEPGPEKLSLFVGVMVSIAGIHLCMWARASSSTEKAAHAKVVTMTVGFIVGLAHILGGGGMVNPG